MQIYSLESMSSQQRLEVHGKEAFQRKKNGKWSFTFSSYHICLNLDKTASLILIRYLHCIIKIINKYYYETFLKKMLLSSYSDCPIYLLIQSLIHFL